MDYTERERASLIIDSTFSNQGTFFLCVYGGFVLFCVNQETRLFKTSTSKTWTHSKISKKKIQDDVSSSSDNNDDHFDTQKK